MCSEAHTPKPYFLSRGYALSLGSILIDRPFLHLISGIIAQLKSVPGPPNQFKTDILQYVQVPGRGASCNRDETATVVLDVLVVCSLVFSIELLAAVHPLPSDRELARYL